MFREPANSIAGFIVVTCLALGLYAQYPAAMRLIGISLFTVWGIAKFVNWRWSS